jgi:hypothetical protein
MRWNNGNLVNDIFNSFFVRIFASLTFLVIYSHFAFRGNMTYVQVNMVSWKLLFLFGLPSLSSAWTHVSREELGRGLDSSEMTLVACESQLSQKYLLTNDHSCFGMTFHVVINVQSLVDSHGDVSQAEATPSRGTWNSNGLQHVQRQTFHF